MKKYILSIDQGTTGTTAALIETETLKFIDKVNQEYPQIYPKPSWVEHDLNDIWNSTTDVIKKVLDKNNTTGNDIECIGITNQRETVGAFSKSGIPLHNAIVWQDRRTTDLCESLRACGKEELIKNKTGLALDPYFSGSKINWLLKNVDSVKKAKSEKDLLFGNIDTFLLYRLTGNQSHCTEGSNASRTMLYNIIEGEWDHELLEIFDIPQDTLPDIKNSFDNFGVTKGLDFLPDGIPITGILGDQQAALFGQAGINKGDMKCTYGTGAFFLLNTGEECVYSNAGLLSTVAYRHNNKNIFALEGSTYIAGAAVQWLRDNLNIIETAPQVEELAQQVTNLEQMEHILFLPFFTGIGSPYWKPHAKAAIIGMTRDTSNPHIARACLEGVCLSINDLINASNEDAGVKMTSLKVDGGASQNDFFMQLQANFSDISIIRPKVIETTAYGAALAAAIGSGICNFDKVEELWREDHTFHSKNAEYFQRKKAQWTETIRKLY